MVEEILAAKKENSQTFLSDGDRIPITKVQAGPCLVAQIKNQKKDGYRALQLGFGQKKAKQQTKALAGHLKKAQWPDKKNLRYPRFLKEVKLGKEDDISLKVGDVISANQVLKAGDLVNVTGISRGKGFTGVMKRWGFKGGPRTHGQSDRERAPGSIGQTTTPGRVFKGKKMPGRSGSDKVTIQNLLVVKVNEGGEIWIKGQLPGPRNALLTVKKVGSVEFAGLHRDRPKPGKKEKPDKKAKSQKAKKKDE